MTTMFEKRQNQFHFKSEQYDVGTFLRSILTQPDVKKLLWEKKIVIDNLIKDVRFNATNPEPYLHELEKCKILLENYEDMLWRFGRDNILAETEKTLDLPPDLYRLLEVEGLSGELKASISAIKIRNNGWHYQCVFETQKKYTIDVVRATLLQTLMGIGVGYQWSFLHTKTPFMEKMLGPEASKRLNRGCRNHFTDSGRWQFMFVPKRLPIRHDKNIYSVKVDHSNLGELYRFVEKHKGKAFADAQELNDPDHEMETLNQEYRKYGRTQRRFSRLGGVGNGSTKAATTHYVGDPLRNIRFLTCVTYLTLDHKQKEEEAQAVTLKLLQDAMSLYEDFPFGWIPVLTDEYGREILESLGAQHRVEYTIFFASPEATLEAGKGLAGDLIQKLKLLQRFENRHLKNAG